MKIKRLVLSLVAVTALTSCGTPSTSTSVTPSTSTEPPTSVPDVCLEPTEGKSFSVSGEGIYSNISVGGSIEPNREYLLGVSLINAGNCSIFKVEFTDPTLATAYQKEDGKYYIKALKEGMCDMRITDYGNTAKPLEAKLKVMNPLTTESVMTYLSFHFWRAWEMFGEKLTMTFTSTGGVLDGTINNGQKITIPFELNVSKIEKIQIAGDDFYKIPLKEVIAYESVADGTTTIAFLALFSTGSIMHTYTNGENLHSVFKAEELK
ncbi:MAG: hypothetical protein RSC27_04350 [Bacilli bacterium]